MAQHDYNLANQNGAAFRADLNAALAAIQSVNSGATEPASTVAYMPWADTNSGLWKVRNAADSAWVSVMSLTASRVDTAGGTSYDNSGSDLAATTVKDALDELDAAVTNVSGDYYSTTNILGTVSQAGGVPTGAIIERGSNANGDYVKYADGTLICNFVATTGLTLNAAIGSIYYSDYVYTWTLPASPISPTRAVSFATPRTANAIWAQSSFSSGNQVDVRVYGPEGFSLPTLGIELCAIGRWY